MIENLKIALKRQKRLLIIFLLTIFLPSVSLSIFGIRAIRNERFRLAKQVENEHRRAADFLKTHVNSQFRDVEILLQNLAQYPSFSEKEYSAIKDLLDKQFVNNALIEEIFLVYKDERPSFPLFQPVSSKPSSPLISPLKESQRERLKKAEEFEFKHKRNTDAVSLYRQIFFQVKDKNIQAQMLNNIGRCNLKLKKYNQAITYYQKICDDYPESTSSSHLPLCLLARLQILDCYKNLGDEKNALESAQRLYEDILQKPWGLSEDQFKTYSVLVKDVITAIFSDGTADFDLTEYKKEFMQLERRYEAKRTEWQVINNLRNDIIPELQRRLLRQKAFNLEAFQYSKTINEISYLILAALIPDKSRQNSWGILGLKINNEYLIDQILEKIVEEIQFNGNTDINISDLSGNILLGERKPPAEQSTVTDFFLDNFPPWRIEFFRSGSGTSGVIDIQKSFYFWTILTLIIILIFGTVLIVRTIAHEMEVLKIKSDFVSSVSHEFKTPLTSIKALLERLQEGKVKDEAKMREYYSVISQDADKLTKLVRNILDFSKIEEGKKEYDFVKTEIGPFVAQQVKSFTKNEIQGSVVIQTQISEDLPPLYVDRNTLSLALINLLDNAVKFSRDSKEIHVRARREEDEVIIEVQDKGIGIPPEELGRIFDKFYQGKNSLKLSIKGTGLGLTLVKHTIEAHGGRVSVSSKVGQGSSFSLIFPVKKKGD